MRLSALHGECLSVWCQHDKEKSRFPLKIELGAPSPPPLPFEIIVCCVGKKMGMRFTFPPGRDDEERKIGRMEK